jgi:formate C-acetyltransferase
MSTELAHPKTNHEPSETRGQRLWRVLRERREEPLSLERAKLVTTSYKETEGLPVPIRRARAFEKIVNEIPIYIDEDQLLAGDYGSRPMAIEWFPEYIVGWVPKEIEAGKFPYATAAEDISQIHQICDYWKDKSVNESLIRYLGEGEINRLFELTEEGAWVFGFFVEAQGTRGWNIPNYPKAIRQGLLGILAEVEEELQKQRATDDASFTKTYFLEAMAIELKAAIQYGKRYAALARDLAKTARGKRRQELERIADICDRVPANPARTFYEAVQTMWFCHVLMYWDAEGFGVSPGRVDQYLYPYYKQDIAEGMLTQEEAIELLECLRIKLSSKRNFVTQSARESIAGDTQFHNCTLGGQTADGKDATNELSFLWLEAAMRTRTPHPTLSVRWHENLSPDFALKAAELCRLGLGFPAWFGDKTSIPFLLEMGASLDEARDYAIAGCILHAIPHKTAATWPIVVSMPKVFELTLNGGVDPRLGKQLGPKTGRLENFETYEELYEAYKKQVKHFLSQAAIYLNKTRLWRAQNLPQLFTSCFFDDCIKRGQDIVGGGAHYQETAQYLLPIGVVDVADSLAAVKKRVYEEGSASRQELMQALKANFEGKEDLRRLLLSAPKYGNDDDYADNIVADIYRWLTKMIGEVDALYGAKFVNAPHNLSYQGATGRKVGALPSGRLAGLAVADGAVSPCQGADHQGPTAVVNSAGKIDHLPIYGTLLNMKFHPSALKTKEGLLKFLALIRTYLDDYGGKHIQFNVVSRETLRDAQEHPDKYRNLVVRVAGYSALWVELDRTIQDEIIARTEHTI